MRIVIRLRTDLKLNEIGIGTNGEAEQRFTMVRTFRYQVVQSGDRFIIQDYVDR